MIKNSDLIIKFAKKMGQDLQKDPDKQNWQNSDMWWYLSQIASQLRKMDKSISNKNSIKEVNKAAVSIANLSMIIAHQYPSYKDSKV